MSLNRRTFLGSAAAASLVAAAGRDRASAEPASASPPSGGKLRGVNLGGWLVLEKWIAPEVFEGTNAGDEYSLSQALGPAKAADRLRRHRESWITADDFKWLADRGINSVRIPVGYWVAEENPPFVTGMETLEWAFRTAAANGLTVLLDLHGAPGSQNGWDHSGRAGTLGWHTRPENVEHTLRVVEDLAARCAKFANLANLAGFELLNEPRWDVPIDILKRYYQEGYHRVRRHLPTAAVVIHDAFRPMEWAGFMQAPEFENVLLDTHLYQCFTDEDRNRDLHQQIEIAAVERKKQLDAMQRQLPGIVGEWSCALDPHSLRGATGFVEDAGTRGFGDAQLLSYESTRGWYFWTYKTHNGGGWSFRDCVRRGWMPERYRG